MKHTLVIALVIILVFLMYRFPHAMLNPGELVEGHQELNDKCMECHDPFLGLPNYKCIACHKAEEIGMDKLTGLRDTNARILFHEHLSNQECTSCHTDHKGMHPDVSISSFSHDILPAVVLNNCRNCHVLVDDQLHRQLSSDCKSCHVTRGWKTDVTFSHDMIQGTGKTNCGSCHQAPADDLHRMLEENCDRCHTTTKWIPATFNHAEYFELDKDHNVKCNVCHTNNNFNMYTCYGCHEHSESKIMDEHLEEGISDFADCASCHRSGDKHDIRERKATGRKMNQEQLNGVKEYIRKQEKKNIKDHREHDND